MFRTFLKVFTLLIFIVFILYPKPTFASGESINSFDSQIIAHKDGTFDVKEIIRYSFGDNSRHGIFRNIPRVSQVGDLYRTITLEINEILRDGINESYSVSDNGTQTTIKIGNPNKTITGIHTYTISYLVRNGIGSNYPDHDEIYWNITGNEWEVPILFASASITTDFGANPSQAICYTGIAGSKQQDCDFSRINQITTTQFLGPYDGLTGVWKFPKDAFPASVLQTNSPTNSSLDSNLSAFIAVAIVVLPILLFLILNLLLAPMLLIWYFKNKRKEKFGPPTVNFDLPKDNLGKRIAPAQAGSIDIHRVDQNDVIATIFDLAIRKYIRIEHVKKEKTLGIFGSDEDFKFTKLKESDMEIVEFEKVLLDRLFENGESTELSDLKTDFYQTFIKFEETLFKSLVDRSFYAKNPKNQMIFLLIVGIFSLFFGGLILGPVLIYLSRKLNGRTALGDEIDWKIDGLKIFLKNMKRHYTFQTNNLYTVEKYIPYAIAFGFIKEFMEELKVIYPDYHPTWYSGNLAFYGATSNMFSSMSTSFTTHAPSSSSGFSSGGGFSGGGGGGGGGGSW